MRAPASRIPFESGKRGNIRIRFGRGARVFLFKHIISDEKASLCDLFIQVSLVSLSSGEAKMSNLTILFRASTIP